MGRALYRKYRSKSLDEIVGQEHITDILRRAIEQDKIAHAYLMTGPKGTGKTSIARILAHEINNLPYTDESTHLDIIEIDAASNNGVDDVRELRERVQIAPTSARKKVYIIDEVHMLTKQAFNALLKTLEEPPEHVVFILATTDVDKVPATIISRVQRYTFHAIARDAVTAHLKKIADSESIVIDEDALELIAEHGNGSFRDSISLLDQLSNLPTSSETITRRDVEKALGLAADELLRELLVARDNNDLDRVVALLTMAENSGMSATVLAGQLINQVRKTITDHPTDITLLEQLMDVGRASYPYIKLLAALSTDMTLDTSVTTQGVAEPQTTAVDAVNASPVDAPKTDARASTAKKTATKKSPKTAPAKFDWQLVMDATKDSTVALRSLLQKSTPLYDNSTLTLYTGNKFNKKQLDTAKYSQELADLLRSTIGETEVVTIGEHAPVQNSQAASVIAMMGGGEIVNAS